MGQDKQLKSAIGYDNYLGDKGKPLWTAGRTSPFFILVFPRKLHFSLIVLEQTWDSQSSRWDVTSMGVVLGVAKADLKYRDDRQIVCGKIIESCMRDRRRLSYKIIGCIGYRKMLHVQ